jgi:protein involved in polysaccharide export with SLBB domain
MKRFTVCLLSLLSIALPHVHADSVFRDGDVCEMSLSGPPEEFTREFNLVLTVDQGAVTIPLIGRVKALGISSAQLASAIESRFKERKVFSGNVKITVKPILTQHTILVRGAVRGPGKFPWSPNLTLTGAISAAGGFSGSGSAKIIGDGKAQTYSTKAIRKAPSLDPKLQPGDIIDVEGD